jgi:hypothetical protein
LERPAIKHIQTYLALMPDRQKSRDQIAMWKFKMQEK